TLHHKLAVAMPTEIRLFLIQLYIKKVYRDYIAPTSHLHRTFI
ncbi:22400_t:CDS:1, partial [Racocetra persica]